MVGAAAATTGFLSNRKFNLREYSCFGSRSSGEVGYSQAVKLNGGWGGRVGPRVFFNKPTENEIASARTDDISTRLALFIRGYAISPLPDETERGIKRLPILLMLEGNQVFKITSMLKAEGDTFSDLKQSSADAIAIFRQFGKLVSMCTTDGTNR
jgi:hypothetical protein